MENTIPEGSNDTEKVTTDGNTGQEEIIPNQMV